MSLTISKLELREIHLPLREAFAISSGTTSLRRILLVRLEDRDGAVAWAECVAGEHPNYSSETIDTAWLALREWVAPRVLGRRFEGPAAVAPALEESFRGHRMAKAVVEMGSWALEATRRGEPLARVIGGIRERIPIGISLGIEREPGALVERVEAALARGYRKVKLKIKPGFDVPFVAAVREAVGPDAPLMVDANSAYTLADGQRLVELDRFGLMMIEQPLACDDLVDHADLQARLTTPLCLDESITSIARARHMVALGSGRIVNIKPGRVAGFTASLAIHDYCAAQGVPVWCGGMLESGVGRAYNVALASLSNFSIPGDVSPSARYWERDIVIPEWTMAGDGTMGVPLERPGLGVSLDLDRVENLTVRREAVAEQ